MHYQDWKKINGGSNLFKGWGGEDDDIFRRLKLYGFTNGNKMRYNTATYVSTEHSKHHLKRDRSHHSENLKLLSKKTTHERVQSDGLSNVQYEVVDEHRISARVLHVHVTHTQRDFVFMAYGSGVIPNAFLENIASIRINSPQARVKLFVEPQFFSATKKKVDFFKMIDVVPCSDLIQPYASTRFFCYFGELKRNFNPTSRISIVDIGDVWFNKDPFATIKNLRLVAEPKLFPMYMCPHHKRWIQGCYGKQMWNLINKNSMICAGTIFGEGRYLLSFLDKFTTEIKNTRCNDQGILNVLYYTGQIDGVNLHTHEDGRVLSLNKAEEYNIENAMVIHTGDNPKGITRLKDLRGFYRNTLLFKNVLSPRDERDYNIFLKNIVSVLNKNKIDYVLDGGLLIGAALHKMRIPWDDDMDIYIKLKDRRRATKVLKAKRHVRFLDVPHYSKVYVPNTHTENHRQWNWPFIDIGWLDENSTHVWELRSGESKYMKHIYPIQYVFPSQNISLNGDKYKGPRNVNNFFSTRYGEGWHKKCVYSNWDHKLEKTRHPDLGNGDWTFSIECKKIPWVPFYSIET